MIFPHYELGRYQLQSAAATRYLMGASAPEPLPLKELLALATEDELEQWQNLPLGYSPNQGDIVLRERICTAYRGLEPENILVTAGAQEAIFISCHALLAVGDRVQVITPAFEPLVIIPQAMRAIIPPLISTWMTVVKNSSLAVAIGYPDVVAVFMQTSLNQSGHAIEIVAMVMLFYSVVSLTISAALNYYNKLIQLKER